MRVAVGLALPLDIARRFLQAVRFLAEGVRPVDQVDISRHRWHLAGMPAASLPARLPIGKLSAQLRCVAPVWALAARAANVSLSSSSPAGAASLGPLACQGELHGNSRASAVCGNALLSGAARGGARGHAVTGSTPKGKGYSELDARGQLGQSLADAPNS